MRIKNNDDDGGNFADKQTDNHNRDIQNQNNDDDGGDFADMLIITIRI